MINKKLKNAPLKEVIFELFWKMSFNPQGQPVDPGYRLAVGSFANAIKQQFSIRKRVTPEGLYIYPKPEFQFWKDEATWPVIQVGPGILTINDTEKNYSWTGNFKENINYALNSLINSYDIPLQFERARLQYIDSIDLDGTGTEIESFISDKLQTRIGRSYKMPGHLKGILIEQSYLLDDDSVLTINIRSGKNNLTSKPAVIWNTFVEKRGIITNEKLLDWLESAHNTTSSTFKNMLNPEFYDLLNR